MTAPPTVSTGIDTLDMALDGGLPTTRATLLTGTPGTGKSTLAMQFLQEGLANDERCLFISTEQTPDELRAGFAPFDFDLDHDNLTTTSLHATLGKTVESDAEQLTLQALEGGTEVPGEAFGIPFTSERIQDHLTRYAPCDRIVLDSVSGLKTLSDDETLYRRTVLDLIQFFTDEVGATALLTAEYTGTPEPTGGIETITNGNRVQFNVHGVIRLWRELVEGDYHRFLDIMKMRGVNHDTRRFEIEFTDQGVTIIPRRRFHSAGFIDHDTMATGIRGLDEMAGGGLLKGTGTLLEHDGKANFDVLLSRIMRRALAEDLSLTLVPTVEMKHRRVKELLAHHDKSVAELLDDDRLFIIDMVGAWEATHENVFDVQHEDASLRYILQMIDEHSAGDGQFYMLNTEAKVHGIGREEARSFRYWLEANFITEDDMHLDIHNPHLMADELAAFYVDAAGQVLRTWMDESGLQYLRLKKSPIGSVGTSRLIEYLEDEPYLRVQGK